ILAAGAFGSPHLLMLSGIGPADHLQELGITVKKALPGVGQNLQDHLIVGISALTDQPVSFNTKETPGNLLKYLMFKKGPFSASPLEACSFIKTDPALPYPDMQMHFAPAHGTDIHDVDSFPRKQDGYSILPTLIRPKSIGELRLQSNQADLPPLIDPRYFSAKEDLAVLLDGVKIALRLLQTQAFAPFHKEISYPVDIHSDEALIQHILEKVETCYHPVGTCKMGQDEMSVVDDQLRVHGVEGLRVVDASIMPRIVAGNTNAPTIMIAEKAADIIRGMMPVSALSRAQEIGMG
ncbi:MAG: GMC oxidoreductase, partial [Bacteroidota bacterium]